jgi:hypothetical protein
MLLFIADNGRIWTESVWIRVGTGGDFGREKWSSMYCGELLHWLKNYEIEEEISATYS